MCDTNVPNLDAMDETELRQIWLKFSHRSRNTARELFPAKPKGFVVAMESLGHYAMNKATAMACRRRGDIENATMYEGIAQRIYNRLPAYARW